MGIIGHLRCDELGKAETNSALLSSTSFAFGKTYPQQVFLYANHLTRGKGMLQIGVLR